MLSLGPLCYAIDHDALPVAVRAFCTDEENLRARRVRVLDPSERTPDAGATFRAAIARRPDHDLIFARRRGAGLEVMDALCALVAIDAPAEGCVLVHASAISTMRGIALLTGPPGIGKSTAARHAGPRTLAYNSVLVRVDGSCWPMPFAGPSCDPEVLPSGPHRAGVLVELSRAEAPFAECLSGLRATVTLTKACVRPLGKDPSGADRAACVLDLATRLISLRLGVTDDPKYLATLDAAIERDVQYR